MCFNKQTMCSLLTVILLSNASVAKSPPSQIFLHSLHERKKEHTSSAAACCSQVVFVFFTKSRLQQLRTAPSCRAEIRRSYSADILDFAKGLKCQQADSFFLPFFPKEQRGDPTLIYFNLVSQQAMQSSA